MSRRFIQTTALTLALGFLALMAGEGFWHHHTGDTDPGCSYCQLHRASVDAGIIHVPVLPEPHLIAVPIDFSCMYPAAVPVHFPPARSPPQAS